VQSVELDELLLEELLLELDTVDKLDDELESPLELDSAGEDDKPLKFDATELLALPLDEGKSVELDEVDSDDVELGDEPPDAALEVGRATSEATKFLIKEANHGFSIVASPIFF
jgi:hypothetical protein